jgi:hypothetical protein
MSSIDGVRRPLNTRQPAHRWAEEIERPLGHSRSRARAHLTAPSMSISEYLVMTEIRGDRLSRGARLVETGAWYFRRSDGRCDRGAAHRSEDRADDANVPLSAK